MARLTKIYTRTGDGGKTRLGEGTLIDKHALRVHCMGEVDELNSLLGMVLAKEVPDDSAAMLTRIQHELFELGGELCMPGYRRLEAENTTWLEEQIDRMNESLENLEEFILPGGCLAAAHCHHARTVCRRAERSLTQLAEDEELSPSLLTYINRLSDLLFVAARDINRQAGKNDVYWNKKSAEQGTTDALEQ